MLKQEKASFRQAVQDACARIAAQRGIQFGEEVGSIMREAERLLAAQKEELLLACVAQFGGMPADSGYWAIDRIARAFDTTLEEALELADRRLQTA